MPASSADGRGDNARSGSRSPRRLSAAERRAQFLEVTADLIITQGADAVSMESVAAAAQVNKVLLYRQFPNRTELVLTLFEREAATLDERVATAIAAADGFEDKVRAWIHAWFAYMGRRGTLYYRLVDEARTAVAGSPSAPHRERQRRLIKHHGLWFAETFRIPTDQAFDAAAILYAGLTGAIDRWVASPTAATRKRLEETYVQIMLGGLERMARESRQDEVGKSNGAGNGRQKAAASRRRKVGK